MFNEADVYGGSREQSARQRSGEFSNLAHHFVSKLGNLQDDLAPSVPRFIEFVSVPGFG